MVPVVAFVAAIAFASVIGFLVGFCLMLAVADCESACDGMAMVAGFVWELVFIASLVFATLAAIVAAVNVRRYELRTS